MRFLALLSVRSIPLSLDLMVLAALKAANLNHTFALQVIWLRSSWIGGMAKDHLTTPSALGPGYSPS